MRRTLISPPAVEPVLLDEAKAFLRLDHAHEDDLIRALVAAARLTVEVETRSVLIEQVWRASFPDWPDGPLALPVMPVIAVTRIRGLDAAGAASDLPLAGFDIDVTAGTVAIRPGAGPFVPAASYEIDYRAGYGPTGADVPAGLRQAILMLAAHWYENRSAVTGAEMREAPEGVRRLLAPYRRLRLC